MDKGPLLSVVSFLGFLLISSGFFHPPVETALVFNNPLGQQDSEEPLTMPVGPSSFQQDAESMGNNRPSNLWTIKPYRGQNTPKQSGSSFLIDMSAPPYFYNSILKSLLKRQEKGLMLDVGALAIKNALGGGGISNAQTESKQNSLIQGILRHSG